MWCVGPQVVLGQSLAYRSESWEDAQQTQDREPEGGGWREGMAPTNQGSEGRLQVDRGDPTCRSKVGRVEKWGPSVREGETPRADPSWKSWPWPSSRAGFPWGKSLSSPGAPPS